MIYWIKKKRDKNISFWKWYILSVQSVLFLIVCN